jgi:linoleate 10R-lipoxygenase
MNEVDGTVALTNVVNLLLHKEYDSEVTIAANKKVDAKDLGSLTAYVTEALSMCSVPTLRLNI